MPLTLPPLIFKTPLILILRICPTRHPLYSGPESIPFKFNFPIPTLLFSLCFVLEINWLTNVVVWLQPMRQGIDYLPIQLIRKFSCLNLASEELKGLMVDSLLVNTHILVSFHLLFRFILRAGLGN